MVEYDRGTTKTMANCLVKLQLTSGKLEAIFTSNPSLASFDGNLKKVESILNLGELNCGIIFRKEGDSLHFWVYYPTMAFVKPLTSEKDFPI